MDLNGKRYWMNPELLSAQMADIAKTKKYLRLLIKENAGEQKAWDSELMLLLCEYIAVVNQYLEALTEVLLASPVYNEKTKKNEFVVSQRQAEILKAHASLITISDFDLNYTHGISLTMH